MQPNIYVVIFVTSLVIFILRYFPVVFLFRTNMPVLLKRLLRNIPVGILAGFACQATFFKGGKFSSGISNLYLIGFLVCIVVGLKTKSLGLVVLSGVGAVALATWLF